MKEQTVQLAKKLGRTESHKKLLSIIFTYLFSDRVGDIVLVGESLLLRSYSPRRDPGGLLEETTVKLIILKPGQNLSNARMIKIRLIKKSLNKRPKFTNYEVLAD